MLDIGSIKDLQSAKNASRGCHYCSGEGFAAIFHVDYVGHPYEKVMRDDGTFRREVRLAKAYCVCAAGRWVMINHQSSAPDVFARIPDVYSVLNKGSLWVVEDPRFPPHQDGDDRLIRPGQVRAVMEQMLGELKRHQKPPTSRPLPSRDPIVGMNPKAVELMRAMEKSKPEPAFVGASVSEFENDDDIPF